MNYVRTSRNPDKWGNYDVVSQMIQGKEYVLPKTGGVSTRSTPPAQNPETVGPNTFWYWACPKGTVVDNGLTIVNDHDDHYIWCPSYQMLLTAYTALLTGTGFTKMAPTATGKVGAVDQVGSPSEEYAASAADGFTTLAPMSWAPRDRAFVIAAITNMIKTLEAAQEDPATEPEEAAVSVHDIQLYQYMLTELTAVPDSPDTGQSSTS